MKEAMLQATLGDDVYGEDPTVNELQRLAAEMLGKEASLFVPSGTMGNLISMLVHAGRGTEVIAGDESHIYHYEQGGASALGSLVMHPVPTQSDGRLEIDDLRGAIRDRADEHYAWPGVICLENTHNRCGGKVLPLNYLLQVADLARSQQVPLHLDGARLANAAVALGVPMAELAAPFDSVQLDLSKGLAAPVGGVVAGSRSFIAQARRMRKLLGGGMRQAGVIAAAGIVALTGMVERLQEDHQRAAWMARELAALPGILLDPVSVHTNLVVFQVRGRELHAFIEAMRERGVLLGEIGRGNLRMVTHCGLSQQDVEAAVAAVRAALA